MSVSIRVLTCNGAYKCLHTLEKHLHFPAHGAKTIGKFMLAYLMKGRRCPLIGIAGYKGDQAYPSLGSHQILFSFEREQYALSLSCNAKVGGRLCV